MRLLKKITYVTSAIFLLAAFLLWNSFQNLAYIIITVSLLFYTLTVLTLLVRKISYREIPTFVIPGGLFLISSLMFYSLIDQPVVRVIFACLVIIGYFVEMHNMYMYVYATDHYQPFALENIHGYLNLGTFFLFISSLYGFLLFFSWPSWTIIIVVFLLSLLLIWRTLISYKFDKAKIRIYVFVSALLLAEASLAVNFLPTSYLFNGLVLTVVYYFLINYLRDYFREVLDKKSIVKYTIISVSALVVGILTARWF